MFILAMDSTGSNDKTIITAVMVMESFPDPIAPTTSIIYTDNMVSDNELHLKRQMKELIVSMGKKYPDLMVIKDTINGYKDCFMAKNYKS